MKNLKFLISYDGTNYLGWQKSSEGPSVEEVLQNTLQRVLQHPIRLQAASRTDRGVHAHGQIGNFFTDSSVDLQDLQKNCNALLPKDIFIREIELAKPDFHPTLDAVEKEYRYTICNTRMQFSRHKLYSWHYIFRPLSLNLMQDAANLVTGPHDFSAFANTRSSNPFCNLKKISIEKGEEKRFTITLLGDRFLYKMVRNIVGTLVYVGGGKFSLAKLEKILKSKDRNLAGITAPAHGLVLYQVHF